MTGQPDIEAACAALDQALKAILLAKSALLGQGGAGLLISSDPVPLASLRGRGRYDAASPAEVAEGAEPVRFCGSFGPLDTVCTREPGHEGNHSDHRAVSFVTAMTPAPALCPAQWGVPPDTMLCSLPSGHGGNHATAEGIEWAGQWETAEPAHVALGRIGDPYGLGPPAGYGLHSIEIPPKDTR